MREPFIDNTGALQPHKGVVRLKDVSDLYLFCSIERTNAYFVERRPCH